MEKVARILCNSYTRKTEQFHRENKRKINEKNMWKSTQHNLENRPRRTQTDAIKWSVCLEVMESWGHDSRSKEGGVTVILRKEKQSLQRFYLETMKIHLHEDTFTQKSRKIPFKKWLKNLWQSEQHNYENGSSWPKIKKQGAGKSRREQFHWENVWKKNAKIILKKNPTVANSYCF